MESQPPPPAPAIPQRLRRSPKRQALAQRTGAHPFQPLSIDPATSDDFHDDLFHTSTSIRQVTDDESFESFSAVEAPSPLRLPARQLVFPRSPEEGSSESLSGPVRLLRPPVLDDPSSPQQHPGPSTAVSRSNTPDASASGLHLLFSPSTPVRHGSSSRSATFSSSPNHSHRYSNPPSSSPPWITLVHSDPSDPPFSSPRPKSLDAARLAMEWRDSDDEDDAEDEDAALPVHPYHSTFLISTSNQDLPSASGRRAPTPREMQQQNSAHPHRDQGHPARDLRLSQMVSTPSSSVPPPPRHGYAARGGGAAVSLRSSGGRGLGALSSAVRGGGGGGGGGSIANSSYTSPASQGLPILRTPLPNHLLSSQSSSFPNLLRSSPTTQTSAGSSETTRRNPHYSGHVPAGFYSLFPPVVASSSSPRSTATPSSRMARSSSDPPRPVSGVSGLTVSPPSSGGSPTEPRSPVSPLPPLSPRSTRRMPRFYVPPVPPMPPTAEEPRPGDALSPRSPAASKPPMPGSPSSPEMSEPYSPYSPYSPQTHADEEHGSLRQSFYTDNSRARSETALDLQAGDLRIPVNRSGQPAPRSARSLRPPTSVYSHLASQATQSSQTAPQPVVPRRPVGRSSDRWQSAMSTIQSEASEDRSSSGHTESAQAEGYHAHGNRSSGGMDLARLSEQFPLPLSPVKPTVRQVQDPPRLEQPLSEPVQSKSIYATSQGSPSRATAAASHHYRHDSSGRDSRISAAAYDKQLPTLPGEVRRPSVQSFGYAGGIGSVTPSPRRAQHASLGQTQRPTGHRQQPSSTSVQRFRESIQPWARKYYADEARNRRTLIPRPDSSTSDRHARPDSLRQSPARQAVILATYRALERGEAGAGPPRRPEQAMLSPLSQNPVDHSQLFRGHQHSRSQPHQTFHEKDYPTDPNFHSYRYSIRALRHSQLPYAQHSVPSGAVHPAHRSTHPQSDLRDTTQSDVQYIPQSLRDPTQSYLRDTTPPNDRSPHLHDWSPHLLHDRRSTLLRRRTFQAPSIDESAEGSGLTRRNLQIWLFAVGFVMPLAWITAAVLPLPARPTTTPPATPGFERDLEKALGPLDVQRFENARWWRNVNRAMVPLALGIVAAVIVLVVVAARDGA